MWAASGLQWLREGTAKVGAVPRGDVPGRRRGAGYGVKITKNSAELSWRRVRWHPWNKKNAIEGDRGAQQGAGGGT